MHGTAEPNTQARWRCRRRRVCCLPRSVPFRVFRGPDRAFGARPPYLVVALLPASLFEMPESHEGPSGAEFLCTKDMNYAKRLGPGLLGPGGVPLVRRVPVGERCRTARFRYPRPAPAPWPLSAPAPCNTRTISVPISQHLRYHKRVSVLCARSAVR